MHAVILDGNAVNPGDLSWAPIEALAAVTLYPRTAPADVISRCLDADIVLTNKVMLTADVLAQLPRLRLICEMATGYNNIDCEAARRLGITVTNIPAYSTQSVAQMVFAHLLAHTNHVEHYTRDGRWAESPDFCYWDTPLPELAGRTFGIVGLGRIGMAVARIALAFGMKVVALTSKTVLPEGITRVNKETLLRESDVVSLHCPLTPATRHLIQRETLRLMKPTAILINTARGAVVDEEAVAQALHAGTLGAYAADVLQEEPPSPANPLLHAPRVTLTPHIAWATREARLRLMDILVGNIKAYMRGERINVVN